MRYWHGMSRVQSTEPAHGSLVGRASCPMLDGYRGLAAGCYLKEMVNITYHIAFCCLVLYPMCQICVMVVT